MAYWLLEPITFILEPSQMAEIAVNLDFDLPIWHNTEWMDQIIKSVSNWFWVLVLLVHWVGGVWRGKG